MTQRCMCKTQKGRRCKNFTSSTFCHVHKECTNPITMSALDLVLAHQSLRFKELHELLKNPKVKVILPGTNGVHFLGVGIAKNSWPEKDYQKMHMHLNQLVAQLVEEYPTQVSFGMVGNSASKPPSKKNIHVWGANASNWNLKNGQKIHGSGQASAMGKQKAGVFGISTMPDADISLLSSSKTRHY